MKQHASEIIHNRPVLAAAGLAGALALAACGNTSGQPDRQAYPAPSTQRCVPGMLQLNGVVMDKARQDLLLHNKLPASMWTHFTDNTGHSQREITDFLVLRQHGGAEADKPSWDYVKQLGRIVDHDVQPGVTQRLMFGEGRVGNDDLHGGKVAIVAGIYQNCLPGQPSHPGGGTARV